VLRFVERHIASRDITPIYSERLRKRSVAFAKFAGTSDLKKLFTEDNVNRFLASLTLSPFSIRCYRADLLSIWNGAADLDLLDYPRSRRIRRTKCPELIVECYSLEEANAILKAAGQLRGVYRFGAPKREFWQAVLMLAWDTGLRKWDVLNFRLSSLRPDGTARILQHKTRQALTVRLRPATIEALNAIGGDQPCKWPHNPTWFSHAFKRLVEASGVNRGTFRWFRRSSGSFVEMAQPGSGHKHLGHSCPQIFTKHYDAQLAGHNLPLPPPLDATA
jgi:integrase